MGREATQDMAVEKRTTLSELQGLLATNPDIFGDQLQEIKSAVEHAEAEIKENGQLSQNTAEYLDDLHRPFKPDFLR